MTSPDPRRTRRSVRELALNVGAVAGVLCILAAVASLAFGITPLIFRSGSMAPQIPTGSLALARSVPAGDLRVGDVVSVDDAAGTRITHRIAAVETSDDTAVLTLQGDANRVVDPAPYTVTQADRVLMSVPLLGYPAAWLTSKTAVFCGGLLAGALLMLAFGPHRRPESAGIRRDADCHPDTDADTGSRSDIVLLADAGTTRLQEAHRG